MVKNVFLWSLFPLGSKPEPNLQLCHKPSPLKGKVCSDVHSWVSAPWAGFPRGEVSLAWSWEGSPTFLFRCSVTCPMEDLPVASWSVFWVQEVQSPEGTNLQIPKLVMSLCFSCVWQSLASLWESRFSIHSFRFYFFFPPGNIFTIFLWHDCSWVCHDFHYKLLFSKGFD